MTQNLRVQFYFFFGLGAMQSNQKKFWLILLKKKKFILASSFSILEFKTRTFSLFFSWISFF